MKNKYTSPSMEIFELEELAFIMMIGQILIIC